MPDFELVVPNELVEQAREQSQQPMEIVKDRSFSENQLLKAISAPSKHSPLFLAVKTLLERECTGDSHFRFSGMEVAGRGMITCSFHTQIPGVERFWITISRKDEHSAEVALTHMSLVTLPPLFGGDKVREVPRQALLAEIRRILTLENIKAEIANRQQSGTKKMEKVPLKV